MGHKFRQESELKQNEVIDMNNRLIVLQAKISESAPLQEADHKEFAALCNNPVMHKLLRTFGEVSENITVQLLGVDFSSPNGALQATALQAKARAYMSVVEDILSFATTETEGEAHND